MTSADVFCVMRVCVPHGDIRRFRAVARALTCPAIGGEGGVKETGMKEKDLFWTAVSHSV